MQLLAGRPEFEGLRELLAAAGLETGKGWEQDGGFGTAMHAPRATLEIAAGKVPKTPPVLVEVTALEDVRAVVVEQAKKLADAKVTETAETEWNSQMFVLSACGLTIGFWQSNNPLHNRFAAVEGELHAEGKRFGIVVARWNAVITERLLQGAMDCLLRSGVKREEITVVRVPGAWEIPQAARTMAEGGRVDAVIALGCLLRGETTHYEVISHEVSRGLGQSQQETGVPHAFGVLTCETLEQALDRAGLKAGNKGFEAASVAIEMVSVTDKLRQGGS